MGGSQTSLSPTGSPGSPAIRTAVPSTTLTSISPRSPPIRSRVLTPAGSFLELATSPATRLAACGVSTGATTIYHHRCFASRPRLSPSVQPGRHGSREPSRSRARPSAARATVQPAASTAPATATTTMADPQALLALRLILGDRAMIDFTGREYYVSG